MKPLDNEFVPAAVSMLGLFVALSPLGAVVVDVLEAAAALIKAIQR